MFHFDKEPTGNEAKAFIILLIVIGISFVIAILSMPREFRSGVYPRLDKIMDKQFEIERRITIISKLMEQEARNDLQKQN